MESLNKHLRLFDNFTDELIIQMMNEIAQNNTSGVKLIPRIT